MPNLNLWGSTQRGKTWHEKQVIDKTLKKDRRMRLDWCEQIKGEQNAEASSSMQQIRHFEKLNLAHGSSHAGGSGGAS